MMLMVKISIIKKKSQEPSLKRRKKQKKRDVNYKPSDEGWGCM